MNIQSKTLSNKLFALKLVYRNLVAERRSRSTAVMVLWIFSFWGLATTAYFFDYTYSFCATYYGFGYGLTMATLVALIPLIIIFVLFPVIIFLVDHAMNPSRLQRVYDAMIKESAR